MKRIWKPGLVLAACLAGGVVAPRAGAEPSDVATIDPALRQRIAAAAPDSRFECYAVMADRIGLEELERLTRGLGPREKRRVVAETLERHARASQAEVLHVLSEGEACGEVADVRCLWIANAVVFTAGSSRIDAVAACAGVERIRPVTPLDPEEFLDASASDRESAPGGGIPAVLGDDAIAPNIVQLQAPDVWSMGQEGGGVLVGLLDFGTDSTHPDLAGHIWTNPGEIAGNGVDDDGNGYVDDTLGWDFYDGDNDPMPDPINVSHGTLAAGLVVGDGTLGTTTGMAPGAQLVICRVVNDANFWEAQQYCLAVGVDVLTASVSFKWAENPKPDYYMFRQVCDMELAAGIIHANSVSNFGNNLGVYPVPFNVSTPSNCPSPWLHPAQASGGRSSIMGCAGINVDDDSLYQKSARGPSAWEDITLYDPTYPYSQNSEQYDYPYGGFGGGQPGLLKPDICAYTNEVVSTGNMAVYSLFNGTSASTPQLAGAMALLRGLQPEAMPRHIAAALELSAVDLGDPGKDVRYGSGKLQAFDAARRLQLLGRFDLLEPALGEVVTMDVFGHPDSVAVSYLSAGISAGGGDFNLVSPFFKFVVHSLDAQGTASFSFGIPDVPGLVGLTAYFQWLGQNKDPATWGSGLLTSVPESFTIAP
jgi:subtilisin family serine protease